MVNTSEQPWSNNPNAPRIRFLVYFAEKNNFAGILLGAICYGILVTLFCRCMSVLLYPLNRTKKGTKWGLVAHISAMFSFVTIATALTLDLQSASYVDDRHFPGFRNGQAPGPLGYQLLVYSKAITIVPNFMFIFNQWLADGLLLYRCYIVYCKNFWIIAFPFLMYLACLAMGIMLIDQTAQPHDRFWSSVTTDFGVPYFSISLAINVVLTFMIVIRLVIHSRNIRNAMGAQATGTTGLYTTINTILIESSALYTLSFLLFIVPWGTTSYVEDIFFPPLAQIQVIASFLIVLRVANRSALTSETIASGNVGSLRFGNQGKTSSGDETVSGEYPTSSVGTDTETPAEPGVGTRAAIDEVPL